MLKPRNIQYERADRGHAVTCGAIGVAHLLVQHVGLPEAIDQHIHVLKRHLPYHESDHALCLAYNLLTGGTCIEDLEHLRTNEAVLDGLDAQRIPDPTTAGDFCRRAGFKRILLRGDTDFTQTWKLDQWDPSGNGTFIFGADDTRPMETRAAALPATAWRRLQRPPQYEVQTQQRTQPQNVKEPIVRDKQFKNCVLPWEDVAEFDHRPAWCKRTYRMIVLRKRISVEKGQEELFEESRYFFYLTNDRTSTPEQIVLSANDRCDQENRIEQLKKGVRRDVGCCCR
jgi:hypothetical protein